MGLTADEKKLLEELMRRSQEPDVDEDFEIEIFDGSKGARVPFSKGAKWLYETFGIGDPPAAAGGGDDGQGDGQQGGQGGETARSYFGKNRAGK